MHDDGTQHTATSKTIAFSGIDETIALALSEPYPDELLVPS